MILGEPAGGDDATVLAIDNVPLDLPVAGVGPRLLAGVIDYTAVSVLGVLLVVATIAVSTVVQSMWVVAAAVILFFLLEYGYFAAFEVALAGRTPGKMALSLRVVGRHGGQASTQALLVRNTVRTVDLMVGVFLMAFDPLTRRLGDRLAGTLVIHDARATQVLAVRRVPRGWTAREVGIAESFFRRRRHLEPERAEQMAHALLAAVLRADPALVATSSADRTVEQRLREALDVEGA